jgi:TusE/DsrC/DsvC family sulfur relay protein
MTDVSYDGQTVSVNDEGFFTDPSQWTEDMAPQIAKAEGIDHLTDRHWQVIRFMRQEYQAKGPAKLAAKIAGIPKPRGCI